MVQHFENAPIREAVFELKFRSLLAPEQLEQLRSNLIENFDEVEDIRRVTTELTFGVDAVVPQRKEQLVGYRAEFAQTNAFLKAENNQLSFVQLAPYHSWGEFAELIGKVWNACGSFYNLQNLTSVGVRFTNELQIPFGEQDSVDLEEFITVLPRLPDNNTGDTFAFRSQVSQLHSDERAHSKLSIEAMNTVGNNAVILLDIEVVRKFPNGYTGTFGELEAVLKVLRKVKNTLFSGSITKKMQELIS